MNNPQQLEGLMLLFFFSSSSFQFCFEVIAQGPCEQKIHILLSSCTYAHFWHHFVDSFLFIYLVDLLNFKEIQNQKLQSINIHDASSYSLLSKFCKIDFFFFWNLIRNLM